MTVKEFRPSMDLMANGIAVRLVSFVETVGQTDYWWCEKLFVEPDAIMVRFDHHGVYRSLHEQRRCA
jgi:hypothetical protein